MIENATVTLPLNEFDAMRNESKSYRQIAALIAACFEYECKDNPVPEKCKNCHKENCFNCKTFKESPPREETLAVNVERLINVTKRYALYGKDITSDVEEMNVVIKKGEKRK